MCDVLKCCSDKPGGCDGFFHGQCLKFVAELVAEFKHLRWVLGDTTFRVN